LGVSFQWLTTGIPETQLDFIVSKPTVALYGENIVTGNNNSEIKIDGYTGAEPPRKPRNKKSPCLACKFRLGREKTNIRGMIADGST
jgi:hypothetical protein